MARDLVLVANESAGSAEREQVEAACAALQRATRVETVLCRTPADLEDVLDAARDSILVVAGGDGSLHLVVARLLARDPDLLARNPLGLIPLGTGNDLARGVGLPLDPVEAAAVVLEGSPRPLDLLVGPDDGPSAVPSGAIVVNAAHAGLGAVAAERSVTLKPALGPLAYPTGAVIAAVAEEGYDLTVTVDDEVVHRGATLMVAAANGPSIGGGMLLAPRARPDDGLIDVVVVAAVGPAARVAFAADLRRATHLDRDDVRWRQGRRVRIEGDAVAHDVDGELREPRTHACYDIRPSAWQLLAPRR